MRGAERCSKHAKLWQNNVLYFMTVDAKPNNSVQYNSKNSMKNKLLISQIFWFKEIRKGTDKYMK